MLGAAPVAECAEGRYRRKRWTKRASSSIPATSADANSLPPATALGHRPGKVVLGTLETRLPGEGRRREDRPALASPRRPVSTILGTGAALGCVGASRGIHNSESVQSRAATDAERTVAGTPRQTAS